MTRKEPAVPEDEKGIRSVKVGEPKRGPRGVGDRDKPSVDQERGSPSPAELDEMQRRFSPKRKPGGPPSSGPSDASPHDASDREPERSTELPVDPE